MENNITNKELFYHYAESLGIKINDAQRLMVLALASREEALPQADVIKSVCDFCDGTTDKPTYKLCDKHYSEYENFKQTVLKSVCDHKDTYIVSGVFGGKWCEKCKEMVDKQTDD